MKSLEKLFEIDFGEKKKEFPNNDLLKGKLIIRMLIIMFNKNRFSDDYHWLLDNSKCLISFHISKKCANHIRENEFVFAQLNATRMDWLATTIVVKKDK